MKITRRILLTVLMGLLLAAALALPALASSTGGPVYKLVWDDAFYEGTGILLPKTITEDSLSVSPNRNYDTVQRLKLTFSFSGEKEAKVPANTVEIRLPYSLFRNAAGGNAEYSVVVPLPMDTSFNYYVDTATNELVIYNFAEIDEALIFNLQIDYKVKPSNVWLPSLPNETILPYQGAVTGKVKITRPGVPVVEATTNTIDYSYITDSKLSSLSKSVAAAYSTWPATWGTAPDNAGDYFYIHWRTLTYYSPVSTQPFNVSITDIPGTGGGQIVGWTFDSGSANMTRANTADGWDNNLQEFNKAATAAARFATPYYNGSSFYTSIIMRYPRTSLIQDPNNASRKYLQISNQAKADLVGDYGATDSRTSSVSLYTYAENVWSPPAGRAYMSKSGYEGANGMIDRLEGAWLAGRTAAIPLHYGSYNWSVSSAQQQWQRTMDAEGNYGMLEWTAVHTDNQFSFDTWQTASPYYYPLGKGDYKLTSLLLARPAETVYGVPDAFGNNTLVAQDIAKYGKVVTQVTTVMNPTEADWITLGTSTVSPTAAYTWTFTPADGSAAKTQTGSLNLDLTQLVPNQDVLGVRFLQTSKAAQATQSYYLKMALYPNDYVIKGLRPYTARTGDIRNSVLLYNTATSYARGGRRHR